MSKAGRFLFNRNAALWVLFLSSPFTLWSCSESPNANRNAPVQESDGHEEISEDRLFYFDQKTIKLSDFNAQGHILDIGGGGRGVIGELKGESVVAIDISKRELEEAPAGPLKVVMDATDLKFIDNSFNTATSFFTLIYIPDSDHEKVFSEVYRVLAPGGVFGFSLSGDLIQTLQHTSGTGSEDWDLISRNTQKVVSGIYLYNVRGEGVDYIDKFVVIR